MGYGESNKNILPHVTLWLRCTGARLSFAPLATRFLDREPNQTDRNSYSTDSGF